MTKAESETDLNPSMSNSLPAGRMPRLNNSYTVGFDMLVATLLALLLQEGSMSPGMQAASTREKRQGGGFSLRCLQKEHSSAILCC